MSYNRITWVNGDLITAEKLNNIEDGISAIDNAIGAINSAVSAVDSAVNAVSDSVSTLSGEVSGLDDNIDVLETRIEQVAGQIGSPLVASLVSEMTEQDRVYVYTGEETGYTSGNWYYYDGSAWISGGVYNSIAISTDTTLTIAGKAADAKKVGDELGSLKSDLSLLQENGYKKDNVSVWAQGRLSPNTGASVSSDTTAIYTPSAIYADRLNYAFYLECASGYTVDVFEYTSTAWASYTERLYSAIALPFAFTPAKGRYYRFVLRLDGGGAFVPEDAPAVSVVYITDQAKAIDTLDTLSSEVDAFNGTLETVTEYTSNLNTVGQGRYSINSSGAISAASENYTGMPDYVDCAPETAYTFHAFNTGVSSAKGYYISWMDANGVFIERSNINSANNYVTLTSPANAVKMAFDVYKNTGISNDTLLMITQSSTPSQTYEYPFSAIDYFARDTSILENSLLTACNKGLSKKIITWIDDDTVKSAIPVVKTLCDSLGIKCTFGCITSRLEDAELVAMLKEYQEEGFHIACHSHTHGTWYGDNPYNANEIENDLITALLTLKDNKFLDSNMLVYPGSSPSRTDVDVKAIARKWCSCGVKASGTNFVNYGDGEYLISRQFFDVSSHNASYYTDILDGYSSEQSPWVVFGSHSANQTQFDATLVSTVLQYALLSGWEIMTLNEALKYRQRYYDIQDMFGR